MTSIAGRKALVKVTGVPVVFTDEATTDAGDHQTYQIAAAIKRVWDRATTLVVSVAGVTTTEAYTYNRLTGTVVFATIDGSRGSVTVSGAYLPLAIAIGAKSYSYTLTKGAMVDTDFDSSNTSGGFNTYQPGMLDVTGSIGRRVSTDTTFRDALLAGVPVVITFYSDRAASPDLTCWAILEKDAVTAAIDAMQDGSIDFKGTADDQGVAVA